MFKPPSTSAIYTLSLHDALPISHGDDEANLRHLRGDLRSPILCLPLAPVEGHRFIARRGRVDSARARQLVSAGLDRKSTRLNSSHSQISYAVFCLKKKKNCKRR